jgi:hypothetical protein
MKSKISERFAEAIDACAPKNGKYSWLGSISEIPITSWKSALSGRQRPTVEMLECFCRHQPELAFFVVTGTLPSESQIHTNPKIKELSKVKLEIREILSKEPIDWSDVEKYFLMVSCEQNQTQNIWIDVIYLAIEVSQSNKLLKDFIKEKEIKLTRTANDEREHINWDKDHGAQPGTSKELTLRELEEFRSNAVELEKYRAKKN